MSVTQFTSGDLEVGTLLAQVSNYVWSIRTPRGVVSLLIATDALLAVGTQVYLVEYQPAKYVAVPTVVFTVGESLFQFDCSRLSRG